MPRPAPALFVVGGSAGGVEAIRRVAADLAPRFPAAIAVAIHVPAASPSFLPEILTRAGPLKASHARDGERIRPGRIYVAPPDRHLVVRDSTFRLTAGPRENGFRPAIDPLFRSAARAYHRRLVGVILSGALDDGTAGMVAVKARGGVTVVQDPEDADFPDMPRSALEHVDVDYRLPLAEIGPTLSRLASGQARPASRAARAEASSRKAMASTKVPGSMRDLDDVSQRSVASCPDCGGRLWELEGGRLLRFVCHVGHAFGADTVEQMHGESVERALWKATRLLAENAELHRRLAARAGAFGNQRLAERFGDRLREAEKHGRVLRLLLKKGSDPFSVRRRSPRQ